MVCGFAGCGLPVASLLGSSIIDFPGLSGLSGLPGLLGLLDLPGLLNLLGLPIHLLARFGLPV